MFYAFDTRTGLLVEPDPKAFEIMKGKKCFEVDFPNGTARFTKCKQLYDYKHLLLLRDIWWSKF
jgi:hypothetical protein